MDPNRIEQQNEIIYGELFSYYDTSLAAWGQLFTTCNPAPPVTSEIADVVWKVVYY